MRRSRFTFACARTVRRKGFFAILPVLLDAQRAGAADLLERQWLRVRRNLEVERTRIDRRVRLYLREPQREIGRRGAHINGGGAASDNVAVLNRECVPN